MKIYNSNIYNSSITSKQENNVPEKSITSPSFKSGITGLLNLSGNVMQGIEDKGFLASFLIQDFGGMTVPRTAAGFLRDKEHTGHYNIQEGTEVLGREGLTGPCMMAVAPICLWVAAKAGRSTSINTQLIKRFGNSLKEFLTNPKFDKNLLNKPEEFKQEFYKKNIKSMLEDTLGKENTSKDSVEYILKQVNNMEKIPADAKLEKFRGKAKYRKQCMDNIVSHIDDIKYSKSSNLEMLQKVKFGSDKFDSKKVFDIKSAIDGMMKYSDDAITANKHINTLDEIAADKLKDKSLAKRMITNISMMAATLGVLSVLPKLYARSNTAPGARTKEEQKVEEYNIAFEGRKPKQGLLERLGKLIDKNKSDFVSSELEYNGHNFTNTLMAGLSVFGLLAPRGMRAYSRAQVDEDGKKDLTEVYEILLRDLTSSLAVVFAVPMLTRACVTSYEKQSGFVLMHKDRNGKSKLATSLDLLNPYSKAHVLTNSEINSLYNKIDSKDKMLNFCKYIDKNGGDLQKIISKSEDAGSVFNKNTFELSSIKSLSKSEKNKKIIGVIEKLEGSKADDAIKTLMKAAKNAKSNKITTFARGLTSVPGLLTTFFISPYLLGWFIPRLTYANTRRIHEKQDREREAKQAEKLKANA